MYKSIHQYLHQHFHRLFIGNASGMDSPEELAGEVRLGYVMPLFMLNGVCCVLVSLSLYWSTFLSSLCVVWKDCVVLVC